MTCTQVGIENVALGCFLLFGLPLLLVCQHLWVDNHRLRARLALFRDQEDQLKKLHQTLKNI